MIQATRIRKGMILKVDGELCRVNEYIHNTPGNLRAVIQTKLKNLRTGVISSFRFKPYDKVEKASLESRPMEFLYQDGEQYVFMDTETYEQIHLDSEMVGEGSLYLKENQAVTVQFYDGKPIAIELPKTVDLKVTHCEPGLKSATVTNVGKPITLQTGLVITGPHFIEIGDIVRVDTEEGTYLERMKA